MKKDNVVRNEIMQRTRHSGFLADAIYISAYANDQWLLFATLSFQNIKNTNHSKCRLVPVDKIL